MDMVGKAAVVRHGYQTAAEIGKWRLAPRMQTDIRDRGGEEYYFFEGEIQTCDAFWITQEPWEVRLPMGRTTWVWADVRRVVRDGQTLHADLLGPPQIER
jgi:hypothetical protein